MLSLNRWQYDMLVGYQEMTRQHHGVCCRVSDDYSNDLPRRVHQAPRDFPHHRALLAWPTHVPKH